MTLIELMIVVSLMALLMGTLVFGSGILGGANRRAAATLIVAGVRKGLAHANTTGKPVRLAMNLDDSTVSLEESSSSEVLRGKEISEDDADLGDQDVDPGDLLLADAEAAAAQILSGQMPQKPSFSPVDLLARGEEAGLRSLEGGVRFVAVQTEHDEEPLTSGLAYLYFWPGGVTERAVVQLSRGGSDQGLTVEVSPLTGRADIKRGIIDLPEELFDEQDYSERDEL